MITNTYAILGAIMAIVMGAAWIIGSVVEKSIYNGILAVAYGLFGLIYILYNLRKSNKKGS